MRIVYLKLVNFIGVKAATGLNEIEFQYDKIKQPIIQLYGKNRCGKTVMIQQHHPFSSINLTGDERSDLSLIIPGEVGYKIIVYEVNGDVYHITHTYRPSSKSHTVSSSILKNGEELNPSGGVNTFNAIIENALGINKYVFQFIINGTNLTSFAGMGATQRKTILNKAMGIDIYDKIHRLATDDYRFTNKLISSLNHTKEYLLSTYGSYETLFATLDAKRSERDRIDYELQTMKSKMDSLLGTMSTIQSQNPEAEYMEIQRSIQTYVDTLNTFGGSYDPKMYDHLVDEQIRLNQEITNLRAEKTIVMRDIDDTYAKQHDLESIIIESNRIKKDYDDMNHMIQSLQQQINSIHLELEIDASSQYLFSMLSLAQAINSTCKEIVSSLKHEHLQFLIDMIVNNLDVSVFLMQEGTSLMDSEKEKSVISYIHSMIQTVDGNIPTPRCTIENCLYRNVYDALQTYFNSYQSQSNGKFTRYDLEQMDHAYKNILTIKRLINVDISVNVLKDVFQLKTILTNISKGLIGIDVDYIKYLIEEAAKQEQRNQYIQQLHDAEKSFETIKTKMIVDTDQTDAMSMIQSMIQKHQSRMNQIDESLDILLKQLSENDRKKVLLSNIKHIDVASLEKRKSQLENTIDELNRSRDAYQSLQSSYQTKLMESKSLVSELDTLEKAFDQYVKTSAEIEQHTSDDMRYKAIAEATSSTKGMPVIAIRDTVDRAIYQTNQLLKIMYDNEIELLHPIIDESQFALPFRCGSNKSADIRYGSQSESTLLSLALSLSLASSLTSYSIPLCDELDAYLDSSIRDDFILMLEAMMSTLHMEQMFLISHNLQSGQFAHIVHTIDIAQIIDQYKGGEN